MSIFENLQSSDIIIIAVSCIAILIAIIFIVYLVINGSHKRKIKKKEMTSNVVNQDNNVVNNVVEPKAVTVSPMVNQEQNSVQPQPTVGVAEPTPVAPVQPEIPSVAPAAPQVAPVIEQTNVEFQVPVVEPAPVAPVQPVQTVESVAAEPVKVEVQPTTDNVTTTNNVNNGMNI